ncbi:DUF106 domain-containing protein [archaeon]|nr:MAG: DUF106 domain-containing protein [archaeon]
MFESFLSGALAPLLGLNPVVGVFIIAAAVSLLLSLPYRFLVDQKKMREHKEKVKEIQKRIKEAQKTDQKRANELMTEMLGLSNKQMMANFKPMIPGMILVILFLPWVAATFTGPVALLPFSLPFFGKDFGWLMWYIVASMPMTYMFRKMLGVQ